MKENNYYNKKVEKLYKELNTSISGLTEEEASKRLEEYGENKLAERKKKSNLPSRWRRPWPGRSWP